MKALQRVLNQKHNGTQFIILVVNISVINCFSSQIYLWFYLNPRNAYHSRFPGLAHDFTLKYPSICDISKS